MRMWSVALLAAITVGLAMAFGTAAAAPRRPNVVILLADDLGWGRVGYNNPQVRTPHLDGLAREGVRLDNYYAMLNCSPTRAGLLTGRYPIRYGLQSSVVRPWDTDVGLPAAEVTLAEQLGAAGYRHRAVFGKWHLGHGRREFHPLSQGFTDFFGHYNGFIDYYSHEREGERDLHEGYGPAAPDASGRYLTDLVEARAISFLAARGRDREAFLLYVPFLNPHAPIQDPPSARDAYADLGDPQTRTHLRMVSAMDASVGRILAALDKAGLARDTIVIFASDNGGDPKLGGDNGPLRGGKGTAWEGGVRVPALVRWPAGGLTGGRVITSRIAYVDWMPTILAAAGGPPCPNPLDGIDVMPLLKGAPDSGRPLFTMTGAERSESGEGGENARNPQEVTAVNEGGWKLTWRRWPSPEGPGAGWARESYALFHLATDPFERTDVAAAHPEIVERLRDRLLAFRALEPDAGPKARPSFRAPPGFRPPPNWAVDGAATR